MAGLCRDLTGIAGPAEHMAVAELADPRAACHPIDISSVPRGLTYMETLGTAAGDLHRTRWTGFAKGAAAGAFDDESRAHLWAARPLPFSRSNYQHATCSDDSCRPCLGPP